MNQHAKYLSSGRKLSSSHTDTPDRLIYTTTKLVGKYNPFCCHPSVPVRLVRIDTFQRTPLALARYDRGAVIGRRCFVGLAAIRRRQAATVARRDEAGRRRRSHIHRAASAAARLRTETLNTNNPWRRLVPHGKVWRASAPTTCSVSDFSVPIA